MSKHAYRARGICLDTLHRVGLERAMKGAKSSCRPLYTSSPSSLGRHQQHEPFVGRRKYDLTREPAFRAEVLGREIQGIALDRLGRCQQMLASGCHIDVACGAYAGATAF